MHRRSPRTLPPIAAAAAALALCALAGCAAPIPSPPPPAQPGLTELLEQPAERALYDALRAYDDGQYAVAEAALRRALGGGRVRLMANFIYDEIFVSFNLPNAAAASAIFLVCALASLLAFSSLQHALARQPARAG